MRGLPVTSSKTAEEAVYCGAGSQDAGCVARVVDFSEAKIYFSTRRKSKHYSGFENTKGMSRPSGVPHPMLSESRRSLS